jgi:hypothetical protein
VDPVPDPLLLRKTGRAGSRKNNYVGFEALKAVVMKSCSAFILVSFLVYFSKMKMEATCSSETSVDFQRTTRRYIPEDRTLHTNNYYHVTI